MKENNLTPLLLGLDLGAYSMAVAFHEATGAVSHAFGRERLGATSHSKIVIPHIIPDILEKERAISEITNFCRERECVFLVPCEDWYVRLLSTIRDRLPDNVKLYMPDGEILKAVSDKVKFYEICDGFGVDYPKTAVFYSEADLNTRIFDSFSYPAVVKPSDSTEYWKHKFDGMRKVFYPMGAPEAEETVRKIFASGYRGAVILQEKIGTATEKVGVYTVITDKAGKYAVGAFGNVLLGEPTPTGTGNHVAISTAKKPEICKRLDRMLEKIGYSGIANFDLISDGRRWYVLELNPRQGRSCDYMRGAGINIAEAILAMLLGHKYEPKSPREILWRCISRRTLYRYCRDRHLLQKAKKLIANRLDCSPYSYSSDIKLNPIRAAYTLCHTYRHSRRFKGGV